MHHVHAVRLRHWVHLVTITPMEAARSRELVADAMRRFAAEDINPVVRDPK